MNTENFRIKIKEYVSKTRRPYFKLRNNSQYEYLHSLINNHFTNRYFLPEAVKQLNYFYTI